MASVQRVLVVDDHPIICDALARYFKELGPAISAAPINISSAQTLEDAAGAMRSARPDIVFLDLNLDSQNRGTLTLERFQAGNFHDVPVVVFTALSPQMDGAADIVRRCLNDLGARYIILKGTNIESMFIGLRRILVGEPWTSDEVLNILLTQPTSPTFLDLTPRQWDVARGITRGLQNKEIAAELNVSPNNVRQIVTAIYKRLGIHSRVKLAEHVKLAEGFNSAP